MAIAVVELGEYAEDLHLLSVHVRTHRYAWYLALGRRLWYPGLGEGLCFDSVESPLPKSKKSARGSVLIDPIRLVKQRAADDKIPNTFKEFLDHCKEFLKYIQIIFSRCLLKFIKREHEPVKIGSKCEVCVRAIINEVQSDSDI